MLMQNVEVINLRFQVDVQARKYEVKLIMNLI
jgi:hypothetical protein